MKYSSLIDNKKSKDWGLNLPQAYLFSWLYSLPSWADNIIIKDQIFYFASKNKAIEELPMLTQKRDTIYRHYKQLEKLGLINLKKVDGKDYINLTEKSKQWNNYKNNISETNPKLGNKSENNSEINPTNNITIYNNNVHSTNERKTKNINIGIYNYDYSERHKGLDYESNVKIDESYSETDFSFLTREKTDESLPNNHYLIMLKKELGFNIFWREYKKKVGRKKAKDAFMKLKYKDVVKIIATVKEYVSVNSDEQYRKHPLTYLNGRCWEDDLTSKKLILPHNWRYMRLNDEQRKLLTPEQLKSYDRHVNKGEVEGHIFKPAPMIYE